MTDYTHTGPLPLPETTTLLLDNASFSYDDGVGLGHVTLDVQPGEALALIGPNGSGKSTLLKGILGILPLTAGRMLIFGSPRIGANAAAVGYLPQDAGIDPDFPLTLKQVVMMGRYRRMGWWRLPSSADRRAVADALRITGLTGKAGTRFGRLSGGQQQRGLLARALATKPMLLLLDEPFNGLDQPNRDALLETISELKKRGVAVIVTTHDLELSRAVCDKVLLVNGEQIAWGTHDEVLTLANLQTAFKDVQVELDEHTVVLPGHEH